MPSPAVGRRLALPLAALCFLVIDPPARALEDEDEACLDCHAGPGAEGPEVPVEVYSGSAHAGERCPSCHQDAADEEAVHDDEDHDLPPVACGDCHDEAQEAHASSIHGRGSAGGCHVPRRVAACGGRWGARRRVAGRRPRCGGAVPDPARW